MELTFSFHIKKEPIVFLAVSTYLKETNIALIIWLFWDNKKWLLCMQFSPVIIMNKGDAPRCTRITISINCFDFSNKKKKKNCFVYTTQGKRRKFIACSWKLQKGTDSFPLSPNLFLIFFKYFFLHDNTRNGLVMILFLRLWWLSHYHLSAYCSALFLA